jgi:thiamine biosynthesis lipoprotein
MLMIMIINNSTLIKFIFLLLLLFLAACQNNQPIVHKHQLYVFGTLVDINIWHEDLNQVEQAVSAISDQFNTMHQQWHAWKPGRLQNINQQLQAGKTVELTTEEAEFIKQTILLAEDSEHLFNPTIGKIINLWGFHTDEYPILTPPPTPEVINQFTAQKLDVSVLHLQDNMLFSSNPDIWLDFGGIAKGYAIDLAMTILRKHNINDAIINAGGDLRSIGSKGKRSWRVAIQSPADWSTLADFEVNDDESVFTSGNYQRYKEFDGKRYAHIINPSTGMPVAQIISATVIAENGIKADAAATALVVAGDKWYKTAHAMGIKQALIINDQHLCFTTNALFNRLENLKINCEVVD